MTIQDATPIITSLVGGSLATMLAMVRFVVPRIDRGYKSALEAKDQAIALQTKQQDTLVKALETVSDNVRVTSQVLDALLKSTLKVEERQLSHDRETAVHRQSVDDALDHMTNK